LEIWINILTSQPGDLYQNLVMTLQILTFHNLRFYGVEPSIKSTMIERSFVQNDSFSSKSETAIRFGSSFNVAIIDSGHR